MVDKYLKMKKISKYLLLVSLVTLFTILVVVTQRSYDRIVQTQSKITKDIIVQPISADLDILVLDEIVKRTEYPINYDQVLPTPTQALIPNQ